MFIAIRAARLAGELILKAYGSVKNIGIKDGKGIVTEIDKQSELLIKNLLSKTGYGFLGEESETNYLTEKLWIVDPLDGTSNFVSNISNFCVSIALMIKGSVVLGVIYNPVEEQLFYAVRGKGAYLNEKPIHVSKNKFSINSLVLTTHGYAQKDRELYSKVVDRLVKSCMLRKLGSTALDLCRVARGSADAFVGFGDEIWDYGAGLLIVEEAKSKVTDWNGETKRDNNYFILASSYNCNKFLKRQLKNLQY
ncbi:MAG: Inositol-phosphate phosphatase [Microgenomates group bacterium GW2011_GWA2_37_6]|nr:MAG: Inositol-phosphate phosphatase [Microgenomates group bacterium GW2011_GWA2_37_6]